MRAGALDALCTFEEKVKTRTASGGYDSVWAPQFTISGGLKRPNIARADQLVAGEVASLQRVSLTVRDHTNARRITAEWRVQIRERIGDPIIYRVRSAPRAGAPGLLTMLIEEAIEG